MTDQISKTLEERGERYGSYEEHARITQNIKASMQCSPNWMSLPDHLRETLEMAAHKLGRLLNGNHQYLDTVRDLVGYFKLSQDIMEATDGTEDARVSYVVRSEGEWKDKASK